VIALIAARAANGVIGVDGGLPWHLPDDLKRFKALTTGHTVVMGRRTWETLTRPLPDRTNLVLTRDRAYHAPGATVVHTLDEAVEHAGGSLFVLGGGDVYAAALPHATHLYLTDVHADVEGDARFPQVDLSTWRLVREEHHPADERHAYAFTYRDYER
jgi:dihydrofolate reductase